MCWKLESELDPVRSLVKRIEVKQGRVGGYGNSNVVVGLLTRVEHNALT